MSLAAIVALLLAPCLAASPPSEVSIPGPLRSLLRMAALSQQTTPAQLLPQLAANITAYGYTQGQPTAHLVLLERYLEQAAELRRLAGRTAELRVSCGNAGALLRTLGYRRVGACGAGMNLVTADAQRAFLTLDSGFPLPRLSAALRADGTFRDPYGAISAPLLLTATDWSYAYAPRRGRLAAAAGPVLAALLRHRRLAQLYAALARMDPETRAELARNFGVRGLLPLAPALAFYGAHIVIRADRVMVPGGRASAAAWQHLAGAKPASPARFVAGLLTRDHGWLAAYFDDLWRLPPGARAALSQPARLRRDYAGLRRQLRDPQTTRNAVGSSFRPDTALVLLMHELAWRPGGRLVIPGGAAVWRDIFARQRSSKFLRSWSGYAARRRTAAGLLEALFALARLDAFSPDARPLRMYLTLSAIARARPQGLAPALVARLADGFPRLGDQYGTLVAFPALDGRAMESFLDAAASLDQISDASVRDNTIGMLQGEIGMWQILARQEEIPAARQNASWLRMLAPFRTVRSAPQAYAAGVAGLRGLYAAAGGRRPMREAGWIRLLAGPAQTSAAGRQVRAALAARLRTLLQDQRLVSLDTLLGLGRGLRRLTAGQAASSALLQQARQLRDFELPQPVLPGSDRILGPGEGRAQQHAVLQTHVDLTRLLRAPARPAALRAAVGRLTPFLRDTLVGFNYAYYDPPGGQLLISDPMFVRLHDFSGRSAIIGATPWTTPALAGRGVPGGEGVHLAGSLANLPLVLAEAEEDFLTPAHVQALIWDPVAAELLTSAAAPRWWEVSEDELHAAALYQQAGAEIVEQAARTPARRAPVEAILARSMLPARAAAVLDVQV
ncbi:MAG: hypothetical protein ACRD04_02290, partial [Terriglobales bacterium]